MSDFQETEKNLKTDFRFDRLKNAVERAGGNAQVAGASGIAVSTLSSYMNGAEWKLGVATKIAEACNVSISWLLFGIELPEAAALSKEKDIPEFQDAANIDCYDEEASAGFGRLGADAPKPQKIAISRKLLHDIGLTAHHTIMLKVAGDSMEPTLKAGDRLLLNTAPSHFLNGVTVFVSSGQLMVKRLAPTASGTVRIIADNDRYPTEEANISRFRWGEPDGGDTITIIGRVAYRLQAMS